MPATTPSSFLSSGKLFSIIVFSALLLVFTSCDPYSGKSFKPSLPGYADANKTVYVLGQTLLEISGQVNLTYNKMAAVNDEL